MTKDLMKIDFTQEQVDLIKNQIAPNATADELKLFLYQCRRTGLDPLTRQIYAIHRKQRNQDGSYSAKMSIQTSIDGFRVIAERSGTYAGQDKPVFNYDGNGKIQNAEVTVYRFAPDGTRYPAATGVAFWSEYVQEYQGKPQGLWAKMPHTMISKVAEALALRKAYPLDLSGLYTNDEMNQADELNIKPVVVEDTIDNDKYMNIDDDKPQISDSAYNKALDYAKNDSTIYAKTRKKYKLTPEQHNELKQAFYNNH